MVKLTRIYTRTGDGGRTRLSDLSEVAKTDLRVEAYGDVDEANSAIGLALALGGLPDGVGALLGLVQNELFDLGADLSNPLADLDADQAFPPLRITAASVDRLERWCDRFSADLPMLRSFILPGGTPAAAQLHLARTITRRAERVAWRAATEQGVDGPGGISATALRYLNRLSDLLFILTRVANGVDHEILWVPGGDRDAESPTSEGDQR